MVKRKETKYGWEFGEKELKDFKYIFSVLKKVLIKDKFVITEWNVGDGYLIQGDCYRVHFVLKGLEEFLFGAWITSSDGYYDLDIFAQPIHYIDKFKPSASQLLKNIPIYEADDLDEWDENEMLEVPRYVRNQPYLAWYRDVMGVDYNLYYVSPETAKKVHDKHEKERLENEKYREEVRKKQYEYVKGLLDKSGQKYKIVDNGDSCYPRYKILVEDPSIPKEGVYECFTEDEMEKLNALDVKKKNISWEFFDDSAIFKKKLK